MSKCEVEVLERTLEEVKRERDELRAENERLREEVEAENPSHPTVRPCCRTRWEEDCVCGQYGEWRTHDSHEPPADLAAAQIIYLLENDSRLSKRIVECTVSAVGYWHPGLRYRPALSSSGLPLCSGEGLRSDARYVATDESGQAWQCPIRMQRQPVLGRQSYVWVGDAVTNPRQAPETHRRPGPASESLMEVSRD